MTVAEARTLAEAYAYLELTLPPGASWVDHERYTALKRDGDWYVLRFEGPYEGRHHISEVRVLVMSQPVIDAVELSYGTGPSRLIDAGQWYLIEAAYAGMARAGQVGTVDGGLRAEDTYRAVAGAWDSARAAVDEIEKLLPPGGDQVSGEAVWTDQGRRVVAGRPDAFRRGRLAEARTYYRRALARFREHHDHQYRDSAPDHPVDAHRLPIKLPATLPARTYGEAHVYMDLHPCACGSAQFPRGMVDVLADDDHERLVRYAGPCDVCTAPREFLFRLPPHRDRQPDPPYRFSHAGDPPSELLDAGEWVGVAHGYQAVAEALAAESGGAELLNCAVSAVEEALSFLSPGEAALSTGVLWTAAGMECYRADPGLFTRERLEQWRADQQRRLDALAGHHIE